MTKKNRRSQNGNGPAARQVPMRDFSRSLPMSLLRAREAVMRQFRPSLRQHGLTEQQWRILRALAAIDAVEVTELARTAFLLGPSLSRILRDLEARHLIERKTAKEDQRRSVVSISEKGVKLMAAVAPTSEYIYAEITQRFGARKLAELQDMLADLEQSLAGPWWRRGDTCRGVKPDMRARDGQNHGHACVFSLKCRPSRSTQNRRRDG